MERLAEEQAALRRIATMVAGGSSSADIFATVAEEVGLLLGVVSAAIHRFEPDGHAVIVGSWGELRDAFPVGSRWMLDGDSVAARVCRTERPARVDGRRDEHASGSIGTAARKEGVRSAVGSPVVVNGRPWGAIVAATSVAERLPAGAESQIAQFAELVAMAISNVQARSDLERLAQEQAALRRVATMVAREASAEDVFVQVAEEVAHVLGIETAVVWRYEADESVVVGSWGKLMDALPLGRRAKFDPGGLSATVHRTQRPGGFDLPTADDAGPRWARRVGLHSMVACPIFVDARLWGAIGAGTSEARPMPEDAEARIAQFTELVATALSNVQARSDLAASRARMVAAVDEERRRVVRDLHDGAQQRLVQTVITLKLARRARARDQSNADELVAEALEQAQTATDELRELAHGILPFALTNGGLRAGIASLASRMEVPVEIDAAVDRLAHPVEATAYFIVAEALTNVVKHSHAQHAIVRARLDNGTLHVEVRDDGIGGADVAGMGLVGLRDRASALDGTLQVQSQRGGGTLITASIPTR